MSVKDFENKRWQEHPQKLEFRHRACLDLIASGTVLDIGCGDGLLLSELQKAGIEATGIDLSPEAVARCRAVGLTAVEHSLDEPLPFADNSFDTVTILDVLEHVYDPLPVFLEARRVARKQVIVGVPNFSSLPARLQVLFGRVPENNRPNKGHVYWFNYPVLHRLIKQNGLRLNQVRMNAPWNLTFLAHLFPNLFALSYVVDCTHQYV